MMRNLIPEDVNVDRNTIKLTVMVALFTTLANNIPVRRFVIRRQQLQSITWSMGSDARIYKEDILAEIEPSSVYHGGRFYCM